jgi:hypothetical protein
MPHRSWKEVARKMLMIKLEDMIEEIEVAIFYP